MNTQPTPTRPADFLFSPGEIVGTPAALAVLQLYNQHPIRLLARHLHGDWGEVSPEQANANHEAIANGGRIVSCYVMPANERLWVITEHDQCVTTIQLPGDH